MKKEKEIKDLFVKDLRAGIAFSKAVVAIPIGKNDNAVELIVNGIINFTESSGNALYALGEKICGYDARVLFINY
ncbi:MAG: hypothetical protein Q8N37_00055 [bacterium]|nr:hypothetical protein [bacterium]